MSLSISRISVLFDCYLNALMNFVKVYVYEYSCCLCVPASVWVCLYVPMYIYISY